jgi:hypothetical protein
MHFSNRIREVTRPRNALDGGFVKKTRRRPTEKLSQMTICVHEAGHAVAHFIYRVPFRHVSVIPDDHRIGHVFHVDSRRDERLNQSWNERRSRTYAERLIKCAIAGEIAQRKYRPRSFDRLQSAPDWSTAIDFASSQSGSLEEAMAWCNLLYIQAKQELQLDYNWSAVLQLAKELRSKRWLTYRQAQQVIERAQQAAINYPPRPLNRAPE